jgi:hypothetical protein
LGKLHLPAKISNRQSERHAHAIPHHAFRYGAREEDLADQPSPARHAPALTTSDPDDTLMANSV